MVRCRLTRGAQPLRHRLRDATSPTEGRPWHSAKPCLFARGSPTRGAVERSETERLDEGQPDREALAELNLSVIADALPPPLPRGGLGIPQSFASSPEAPLLGELAGASPTERLDKGQPDREALAKLNLSVIAYAMPPPLPRGGLGIPQSFASSPEAPLLGELSNEVRLRGWTKDSLTASLCWTQPLRHACGVPPPLTRGGLGIPQSLASSPEAPLPGELSNEVRLRGWTKDSLTVSRSWAQPLRHACGVPPPLPRGGLGIPQSFASSPEAPLPGELSAKQTERLDEGQPDREATDFRP